MKATPKRKTKKQSCGEAYWFVKSYEHISFSTFYQRTYLHKSGNWHFIGKAHDYTF